VTNAGLKDLSQVIVAMSLLLLMCYSDILVEAVNAKLNLL